MRPLVALLLACVAVHAASDEGFTPLFNGR
ncbi:MAG: hypothetical protein RLZZ550_1327, partial [Verrucomicrobiota bacterium]